MCKSGDGGSLVAAWSAAAFSPGIEVYQTKEVTWNLRCFSPPS